MSSSRGRGCWAPCLPSRKNQEQQKHQIYREHSKDLANLHWSVCSSSAHSEGTEVLDSHRETCYKVEGRIIKREFKNEEDKCGGHKKGGGSLCCSGRGRRQAGAQDTGGRSQECRPSKRKEKGREMEIRSQGESLRSDEESAAITKCPWSGESKEISH